VGLHGALSVNSDSTQVSDTSEPTATTTAGTTTLVSDYTGQPAIDGTPSQELDDFVGAMFYSPHALADGN